MIDISISNSKKIRKGNSWKASINRKNRADRLMQQECFVFVGNNKRLWHGAFNEGFVYARCKTKPVKAIYEI